MPHKTEKQRSAEAATAIQLMRIYIRDACSMEDGTPVYADMPTFQHGHFDDRGQTRHVIHVRFPPGRKLDCDLMQLQRRLSFTLSVVLYQDHPKYGRNTIVMLCNLKNQQFELIFSDSALASEAPPRRSIDLAEAPHGT